jgi:hypothetical protein
MRFELYKEQNKRSESGKEKEKNRSNCNTKEEDRIDREQEIVRG